MKCKICSSDSQKIFSALILNTNAAYWQCNNCGFIQTDEPTWLPEAYKDPLNDSDTGILMRNTTFARLTSLFTFFFISRQSIGVDYGGGTGIFTRLMRDIGFDWYWQDPHTKNIFARGFEYDPKKHPHPDLVTAFEVFEHMQNPRKELEHMLCIAPTILFSTELIPVPPPKTIDDWWYFAPEHGQHISFYTLKSFAYLAKDFGLHFYSNHKNLHILSKHPIPYFNFKRLHLLNRLKIFFLVPRLLKSKIERDMRTMITQRTHDEQNEAKK